MLLFNLAAAICGEKPVPGQNIDFLQSICNSVCVPQVPCPGTSAGNSHTGGLQWSSQACSHVAHLALMVEKYASVTCFLIAT